MRLIDLTAERFGKLVVQHRVESRGKEGKPYWLCLCDCGKYKAVSAKNLRCGDTTSCGCVQREDVRQRMTIHGYARRGARSSEHSTWAVMLDRCLNPRSHNYANYGGRGITVCPEWRTDFMAFYKHIGPKPTPAHSVDRINNDGNYEPGNVRWATARQQAANKRPRQKPQP